MAETLAGKARGLYLLDEAPADAEAIASYDRVAMLTSLRYSITTETDEVVHFDTADAAWTDAADGAKSASVEVEGYVDGTVPGDTAQGYLETAILGVDQTVYWLITSNVAGSKQRWGAARVSAFEESGEAAGRLTFSATLEVKGAPNHGVVPAVTT